MRQDPLFKSLYDGGFFGAPAAVAAPPNREEKANSESKQILLEIKGMWCGHCSELLRYLLLYNLKGVSQAWIDYSCDLALIQYDPMRCGAETVCKAIQKWGWQARLWEDSFEKSELHAGNKSQSFAKWQLILMSVLSIQIMMLAYPGYMQELGYLVDGNLKAFLRLSWALIFPIIALTWPSMLRKTYFSLTTLARALYRNDTALTRASIKALSSIETLALISTFSALSLSLYTTLHIEMSSIQGTLHSVQGVYLETAAFILTYLAWSDWILSRFKGQYVQKILAMACKQGTRVRQKDAAGKWCYMDAGTLCKGMSFWAIQLDRLVCDARVHSGSAWIDRSWRMGESSATFVSRGSKVYSGDMLVRGLLELSVTSTPKNSYQAELTNSLARMLQNRSKQHNSVTQHLLQFFVPTLLLAAALVFVVSWQLGLEISQAATRALAMLCIGCPCALSLAEPFLDQGLAHYFKKNFSGQLLRPERFREYGQKLEDVYRQQRKAKKKIQTASMKHTSQWHPWYIFDKTGTLTTGVLGLENALFSKQSTRLALSIAQNSQHPLSRSLVDALSCNTYDTCEEFYEIPGAGLMAQVEKGRYYFLGSSAWMQKNSDWSSSLGLIESSFDLNTVTAYMTRSHLALFAVSDALFFTNRALAEDFDTSCPVQINQNHRIDSLHTFTVSEFTHEGRGHVNRRALLIGIATFKETLRPEAKEMITGFNPNYCKILSGDNTASVETIASLLGITHFQGKCTPMDKALHIGDIQKKNCDASTPVLMVGDGINDSLGLARSDFGVVVTHSQLQALGSVFSADLQMPDTQLAKLGHLPELARLATRLSKSNTLWTSIYNFLALILAAFGVLSPFVSAIAMVLSSIGLVLNTSKIYILKKPLVCKTFI